MIRFKILSKNKLFENIVALGTIKGLEYILAFVTFPYLVRVLQVEYYGMIVFSQSIINYFVLFTDYGFNLLGPKEIAQQSSKTEQCRVLINIFLAKLMLLICWTVVFIIGLLILEYFRDTNIELYAIVYLTVIGNVLFPVWFFQGIQQMRYITFVNIVARVFSVIGIFLFVKEQQDYLLAAFCQSITPMVAAACSWVIICKQYSDVIPKPNKTGIKSELKEAWPIFASNIAINLYTASNIVFLGFLTNNTIVGYFSGAKKIIDNVTQLFSPISQAIYPHVSKKVTESKESAIAFLRKVVVVFGGGTFALSLFIILFADWIVRILLGNGYEQSILLLRIMAFLPFLIALSNVFGIQTMLTFGMQRDFSRIIMIAAVFNTCLVLPMIYFFEGLGVCISITLTECFVTVAMWYILRKNHIILWR